jgi:RNA polymerase sigma factor (sigma-70 family)
MTDHKGQLRKADTTWAARRRMYERLARRFYPGVYRYLRWLCRDAETARDLTQDTFVQVWAHLAELRRESAAKAWVFRVARNEYLQRHRRAEPESVALQDCTEAEQADSATSDLQAGLEREALCQAVRQAVERLPALYREVVALHNMEGLPLDQVAEVLGIPEGTVKSRRAKAFSLLRNMLAAEVNRDEMHSSPREPAR